MAEAPELFLLDYLGKTCLALPNSFRPLFLESTWDLKCSWEVDHFVQRSIPQKTATVHLLHQTLPAIRHLSFLFLSLSLSLFLSRPDRGGLIWQQLWHWLALMRLIQPKVVFGASFVGAAVSLIFLRHHGFLVFGGCPLKIIHPGLLS